MSRTSSNGLGASHRCVRRSIGSVSFFRSKYVLRRTSSGTTLPCTGLGKGTLKMFLTLESWHAQSAPNSSTSSGGLNVPSSSK